ncbi:LysM peptidoglycan-binding domain-containing protein [Pseudogemmobacter humi]|uniref:Murein hydrolase activator NlpD n=1 Tax=Pseudogemmobacter humi TaxID=2483812 RepID=A0A3P5WZX2_9RHOB|nr:LysM peptidoglycan-binding domain-containing protein [Pseudogemmobacter humi]VDC24501.1 Murein hydrolase activator NlpD precursor [Pseudogemmobacter humi]
MILTVQTPSAKGRARLRLLTASCGMALLAACSNMPAGSFDWDLRGGPGGTADEARQATAARPVPDGNGVLSYPGYQMAQARRGETVASVAGRLGLNPSELARANALQAGDPLREGELLLLPARVSAAPQPVTGATGPVDITAIATGALDRVETTALPPVSAPAASAPGGGKEPVRHTVKRGETAFIIARSYNVSAKALAEWNGLGSDMAIREGQTLIIPVATAPAPNPEPKPAAPGSGSATPAPPSASKPLPDEKTEPAGQKPSGTPASPDLGAARTGASASKMAMPVAGSVIRGYDKKSNQGVNIGAAPGTPVKAADAGTVAAITKDTEQVQIVVIRHAGGLMTVYAGVDGLKVKKGDSVSRGQQIGVVRSGNPSFLHFEIRKGVDSLDPMPYLQ